VWNLNCSESSTPSITRKIAFVEAEETERHAEKSHSVEPYSNLRSSDCIPPP
jgi:hypothetical protein